MLRALNNAELEKNGELLFDEEKMFEACHVFGEMEVQKAFVEGFLENKGVAKEMRTHLADKKKAEKAAAKQQVLNEKAAEKQRKLDEKAAAKKAVADEKAAKKGASKKKTKKEKEKKKKVVVFSFLSRIYFARSVLFLFFFDDAPTL